MSNQTWTTEDGWMTAGFCLFLGEYAPKHDQHIPMKELAYKLNNLFVENPNATQQDVMTLMTWTPDVYEYFTWIAGSTPNDTAPYMASLLDIAPHPHITGSIVPLFVVFTVLSTIVMALRLWSRMSLLGRIQSFDYAAIFSFFCIIAWGAGAVAEHALVGTWAAPYDQTYIQQTRDTAVSKIQKSHYPIDY